MRKKEKDAFEKWAIAYRADPIVNLSTTPSQALAILIHDKMSDGKWRTATVIADEVKEPLSTVQNIMRSIKTAWGYEAVPSRTKGYRRIM
jgi:hypothetical protein